MGLAHVADGRLQAGQLDGLHLDQQCEGVFHGRNVHRRRRDYYKVGPHATQVRDLTHPYHVTSCTSANLKPPKCDTPHHHRLRDVLTWLIPQVQEELRDPDAFLAAREDTLHATLEDDLGALEALAQVLRKERDRWDAAYRQGYIDLSEFGAGRDQMNRQLTVLSEEAEHLRGRLTLWDGRRADLQEMAHILDDLPQMPPDKRRPVWVALIDHLRLFRGRPGKHWEIVYR